MVKMVKKSEKGENGEKGWVKILNSQFSVY